MPAVPTRGKVGGIKEIAKEVEHIHRGERGDAPRFLQEFL
jgi:hypothetical protein